MNTGRVWAYTGVALGATVSVAANIAHSYVRPQDKPASWAPETGAVIGAAFWPLALAVSSEVLARNAWSGRRRILGIGGVVLVAAVAAVVSYLHLKGLLAHYGEPELTAMIGPLAVDGLMLTSTVALIGSDRSGDESIESGSLEEAAPTIAAPPLPPPSSIDDEAAGRPGSAAAPTATVARLPKRQAKRITAMSPTDQEVWLAGLDGWRGEEPPAGWRDRLPGMSDRSAFRRVAGARRIRTGSDTTTDSATGGGSGAAPTDSATASDTADDTDRGGDRERVG